jgi:hypothetical protein
VYRLDGSINHYKLIEIKFNVLRLPYTFLEGKILRYLIHVPDSTCLCENASATAF